MPDIFSTIKKKVKGTKSRKTKAFKEFLETASAVDDAMASASRAKGGAGAMGRIGAEEVGGLVKSGGTQTRGKFEGEVVDAFQQGMERLTDEVATVPENIREKTFGPLDSLAEATQNLFTGTAKQWLVDRKDQLLQQEKEEQQEQTQADIEANTRQAEEALYDYTDRSFPNFSEYLLSLLEWQFKKQTKDKDAKTRRNRLDDARFKWMKKERKKEEKSEKHSVGFLKRLYEWSRLQTFFGFFKDMFMKLPDLLGKGLDFLTDWKTLVALLGAWLLTKFWPEIKNFFKAAFEQLSGWIKNIWGFLKDFGTVVKSMVIDPLVSAVSKLADVIVEKLKAWINPWIELTGKIWKNFDDNFIKPWIEWFQKMFGIGLTKPEPETAPGQLTPEEQKKKDYKAAGDFLEKYHPFNIIGRLWDKEVDPYVDLIHRKAAEIRTNEAKSLVTKEGVKVDTGAVDVNGVDDMTQHLKTIAENTGKAQGGTVVNAGSRTAVSNNVQGGNAMPSDSSAFLKAQLQGAH